jgi:ABC-type sugar transport system ATPase subunit
MTIEVKNIVKKSGAFAALDNVDLKVGNGELLALLGLSGSGKTTLLRIIAGLDWPDSGEVTIDGEDALAHGASERHVGFVFQHYALFRHMTVFENVAFGLRVQLRAIRKDEATIRARVKELLDLVQLDRLAKRYSSQLSGRQRQRIALARAGDRTAYPAARRTLWRARCEGSERTAAMAAHAAFRNPRHLDLRHPRPGRGARSRQPRCGHGQGPHRADRHAR